MRGMDSKEAAGTSRFAGKMLLGAVLLALGLSLSAAPTMAAKPKLFGTNEISSTNLEKFKKWTGALARYAQEAPNEMDICQPSIAEPCHTAKWRIFLKRLQDLSQMEQLEYVNKYLNQYAYLLDPINYGKKDYWATPRQFMYRTGDCEDYAIAKYVSLLHLGWPKDSMRIVVVQDQNLDIPHAILVVYFNGQALVLDNQIKQVIDADRIRHYRPIFSINEERWWLHRG